MTEIDRDLDEYFINTSLSKYDDFEIYFNSILYIYIVTFRIYSLVLKVQALKQTVHLVQHRYRLTGVHEYGCTRCVIIAMGRQSCAPDQ